MLIKGKIFAIISGIFLVGVAGTDSPVGTCSLQGREGEKEMLPDPMCYEACRDGPEQRHFLTCSDLKCFCRNMNADAGVPLMAGDSPTTTTTTATSAIGDSTTQKAAGLGDIISEVSQKASNLASTITDSMKTTEANSTTIAPTTKA